MPVHPLKTALRQFLVIYQERKETRIFRINPLPIFHNISTENTDFAVFLRLIFHINTSFPICPPTCIGKLY